LLADLDWLLRIALVAIAAYDSAALSEESDRFDYIDHTKKMRLLREAIEDREDG
jgi:hypothetical protein